MKNKFNLYKAFLIIAFGISFAIEVAIGVVFLNWLL